MKKKDNKLNQKQKNNKANQKQNNQPLIRLFDSKYPDWSAKISSFLPKISLNQDYAQLFSNFMIIVAILGALPLTIQVLKVYRTKKVDGISLYAFILQIFIYLSWFCYAFISRNGILIISSSLGLIIASTLVYFVWKYKKDIDCV